MKEALVGRSVETCQKQIYPQKIEQPLSAAGCILTDEALAVNIWQGWQFCSCQRIPERSPPDVLRCSELPRASTLSCYLVACLMSTRPQLVARVAPLNLL